MTNKEIANTFQLLGKIMELHGENKFKIRSYQNAYMTLRKLPDPLAEMSDEQISQIKGVGKAISGKIRELLDTGKMATLERYKSETPPGILDMLSIKGFGPKKIQVVWKELGVESIGELMYAVHENRLLDLKGFGKKTQEDLRKKLEYYQGAQGLFHFATLDQAYQSEVKPQLAKLSRLAPTGAFRRKTNTLRAITLLTTQPGDLGPYLREKFSQVHQGKNGVWQFETATGYPVELAQVAPNQWGLEQFRRSAGLEFWNELQKERPPLPGEAQEEQAVFEHLGLPFIAPELRDSAWSLDLARTDSLPDLLREEDIQGVVHSHSTYSDGINSLEEMATYTRDQGYRYLVITDHSKSAFYANGLSAARVREQFAEIDRLNTRLAPLRIFKGIESDILSNGELDYEEDLLAQFEVVIASVHSNLRMDEEKATQRLLRAIENPYTHILGHPTGRLLLSREGYPIDHKRIIDACAENGVQIELNANPYRLDLDWSWIPYATEKGVQISINPDAHSTGGIHDIRYGVYSAWKGGLTAANCLNAKGLDDFLKALKKA